MINPVPEQPTNQNSALTVEKFEEIKSALAEENISEFPSAFQLARNLLKQAWTSSIDAAKGKPFLATAEKAAARMDICKACQFFREPRCTRCGCFMDKKVHFESSQCPVNKWGPSLQKMYPAEIAQKNFDSPHRAMPDLDIYKEFSKEDAEAIDRLATQALKFDGRFAWKEMQFRAVIGADGVRRISQLQPNASVIKGLPNHQNLSIPEQLEFSRLLVKHQSPSENKVFAYKSQYFYLTPRTDSNGKPGQFMIRVLDPNNLPPGITLPDITTIAPNS